MAVGVKQNRIIDDVILMFTCGYPTSGKPCSISVVSANTSPHPPTHIHTKTKHCRTRPMLIDNVWNRKSRIHWKWFSGQVNMLRSTEKHFWAVFLCWSCVVHLSARAVGHFVPWQLRHVGVYVSMVSIRHFSPGRGDALKISVGRGSGHWLTSVIFYIIFFSSKGSGGGQRQMTLLYDRRRESVSCGDVDRIPSG